MSKKITTLPIALELNGNICAPLLDVQGNIRRLIFPSGIVSYECSAFGESLAANETYFNPWRYSAKRLDPELNLIYSLKRYYDPETARWLTTDPAGFIDSLNLYTYLLNNPFSYIDPDGKSVISWTAILLANPEIIIIGAIAITMYCAYDYYANQDGRHNHTSVSLPIPTISGGSKKATSVEKRQKKPSGKSEEEEAEQQDKQTKGTPSSNKDQNKQAQDAAKEIEKKIGRKLTDDDKEKLHREISGKNYNYQELVDEGVNLLKTTEPNGGQ